MPFLGICEGAVGQCGAPQDGPDAFDRVEVGRVWRQLVGGQPVPLGDELPHSDGRMGVEIVPGEHDRTTKLLAGGLDQVGVIEFFGSRVSVTRCVLCLLRAAPVSPDTTQAPKPRCGRTQPR